MGCCGTTVANPTVYRYYEKKNKEVKKEVAEKLKKGEDISHSHAHLHPSEVVEVLIQNSEFEVPDILVEEEKNRLVARMVDQVIAAGMKTEDYLKAQNMNFLQGLPMQYIPKVNGEHRPLMHYQGEENKN